MSSFKMESNSPAGPKTILSTSRKNFFIFHNLNLLAEITLVRKPATDTYCFAYGTGLPYFLYRGESRMMQVKEEVGLVLARDLQVKCCITWLQFAAYPETWTYALCSGSIEGGFSGSLSSDGALRGIIYHN